MKIYYHEKEKIVSLLKSPNREKRGISLFLRNRDIIDLNTQQINILSATFGHDYTKIKPLLKDKNTIYSFFANYLENIKKINNKRNRRKT